MFGASYESIKDQFWRQLSVEKPINAAREFMLRTGMWGGDSISSMHDVAERGVLGAVNDLCDATGLGCKLDLDTWVFDPSIATFMMRHFPDPLAIWTASGQGAVIMGCRHNLTDTLLEELERYGVKSCKIGSMTGRGSNRVIEIGKKAQPFPTEIKDPFWPAFTKVLNNRS